jgi:hypothetical protein
LFNQSQTWSNSLSISGSWDSGGVTPAGAFDGSLATNARAMGQNMQITFDISSSPLTFTDKVEFYHTVFGMDVSVNGGTVIGNPAVNEFVTLASGGGTLNTITFVNANAKTSISAIRVDGKLLVDPGINLPTIANTGASVGTKQGFSIIGYNGTGANATVSHGLEQVPELLIVKSRDSAFTDDWRTYHVGLTATNRYVQLWDNAAEEVSTTTWNNLAPTNSVFNIGTEDAVNKSGDKFIAYLWHSVPGLQKFGSFEGNQNANGPYVELGFRPAIVWIKCIDNYDPPYDWHIYDNLRQTINPNDKFLCANLNNAENYDSSSGNSDNTRYVDFLSNGFKVRTADIAINLNAHTFIYCAWAEAPTVNLFGGQSNAK